MSSKFERILESKRAYRKDLKNKSIAEKLRIVEELAERSLTTRKDTSSPLSNEPWPIPDSWRWARMGEVATIIGGGTPRTDRTEYFGGEVPWITPADLSDYKEKTIARGARSITQAGLENSGARLLPAGTVLFSSRAPIGYVVIASNPVATNQGFKSFVLRDELLPDFVYYYLQRAKEFAVALASGTTFLEISGKNAARLPIPIPPLAEQRQIVADIEKQFSRLDEAVTNLKRVKANLKRYKAAVLKTAVEGRLVETEASIARREGRSYETGEQLLKRILESRRSQWKGKGKYKEPTAPDTTDLPKLSEGWEWANWEQIGFSQNGRPFPSSDYCDKGVRLLRPGNLHESGALVWTAENTRHMPPQYAGQNPDLIVKGGELVINLTAQSLKDEFLGRVCFTADGEHCLLNQRLARLTPIEVVPEFALVVFKSKWFRSFVDGLNTGSLIQHMFTSQLATFVFPIPPVAEQHRIVAEVDRRLSLMCEVEAQVDANLKRAECLRQSILSSIFMTGDMH